MKRFSVCLVFLLSIGLMSQTAGSNFKSDFPPTIQRVWIGPEYWTNPMQDWRINNGRLECIYNGQNRNVQLLTFQMSEQPESFFMSVRLGLIIKSKKKIPGSVVGFLVGKQGPLKDYRNNLIHGDGLKIGITGEGYLFIDGVRGEQKLNPDGVMLKLKGEPSSGDYLLTLTAKELRRGGKSAELQHKVAAEKLTGNVGLLCDQKARPDYLEPDNNVGYWFNEWRVGGKKVCVDQQQTFGPILFSQYTLSRKILKLTVQMAPVCPQDDRSVKLQIREPGSGWRTISRAVIEPLSRTAAFRIEEWDDSRDVPYRLVYHYVGPGGERNTDCYSGTFRRNPVQKTEIVVAAFTGNQDYMFPNASLVRSVRYQDPDLLFFSGDQIYENVGGYGTHRQPLSIATLDYLRKWIIFGWAFRDLMRDRPCITIPDDHDVYQGNIWGDGGRKMRPVKLKNGSMGIKADQGGYYMPPLWINMVQRTQTSHLPDPFDPTPVQQGIGVYYTSMVYGRIDFAIIEDRKFKTGPAGLAPPTQSGRADHVIDPNFDPKTADVPGAKLLGERQLKFLRQWAADWRDVDMKCVLSQTVFANATSLHGNKRERLIADYDSNGWPQTGRNKALREMRKGFALHICGDQHLATIIHYGIDDFNDAGWSLCVPSVAAGYPRVWAPLVPGKNRKPGWPPYLGEFLDGFGNRITLWAVANPKDRYRKPVLQMARDRASGYGLVRFHKNNQSMTLECWPVDVDPADPSSGGQYPGWPLTVDILDNYGRKAVAYLPELRIEGFSAPVIQVIDEQNSEIVYTVRIKKYSFVPKVFKKGNYTIKVGDPDSGEWRTFEHVRSNRKERQSVLEVDF